MADPAKQRRCTVTARIDADLNRELLNDAHVLGVPKSVVVRMRLKSGKVPTMEGN